MLSTAQRLAISAAAAIGLFAAAGVPAVADDGAIPCASHDICVGVTDPGSSPAPGQTTPGSSGGDGGGIPLCTWNGHQWPCWDKDLGWFDTSDGCYYNQAVPQPPADDPAWQGHNPSSGAVYEVNCRQTDGGLTPKPPVFFAQPPGGSPPPDQPAVLARQALAKIHFDAPELHAAPATTAVVGVPVWLWYKATPTTTGSQSATAQGLKLSVTVEARLAKVHWDVGDGATGVDCAGSGTAYTAGAVPNADSCLYTYRSSSAGQKDQSFFLTATLSWEVKVTVSDGTTLPLFKNPYLVTTDVPLELKVAEVQALN